MSCYCSVNESYFRPRSARRNSHYRTLSSRRSRDSNTRQTVSLTLYIFVDFEEKERAALIFHLKLSQKSTLKTALTVDTFAVADAVIGETGARWYKR